MQINAIKKDDSVPVCHPGVELGANFMSISHRRHFFEVAFAWELTKATIHLPLVRLQGKGWLVTCATSGERKSTTSERKYLPRE